VNEFWTKDTRPGGNKEAARLNDAIRSAPLNRQYLARLVVNTFINGMEAQRELTGAAAVPVYRPAAGGEGWGVRKTASGGRRLRR